MIENRISDRAKILLIDEDTSISYLIRRAMEKENYKIYIAGGDGLPDYNPVGTEQLP